MGARKELVGDVSPACSSCCHNYIVVKKNEVLVGEADLVTRGRKVIGCVVFLGLVFGALRQSPAAQSTPLT